eukprot:XP_001703097.1 predicted protein [Chlamydomonas reinhardtii]
MPAPEVCLDFPLLSEQRSNGSKYAAGPDPEVVSGSSDAPSLPVARQVARSQDGLRAVACVPLQMTHEGFLASPDDDGLRALDARLPREVLADILESLNAAARSHAAASALVFTTLMVATAALAALVLVPYELYKGRKRLAALEDTIKSLNQRYSHGAGGFDDGPAGPMAGAGDEVFGAGGGSAGCDCLVHMRAAYRGRTYGRCLYVTLADVVVATGRACKVVVAAWLVLVLVLWRGRVGSCAPRCMARPTPEVQPDATPASRLYRTTGGRQSCSFAPVCCTHHAQVDTVVYL